MAKRIVDLKTGDYIRGYINYCHVCRQPFVGRIDAATCSPACREKARRQRKERNDGQNQY